MLHTWLGLSVCSILNYHVIEAQYFRSSSLFKNNDDELTVRQLDWSFANEMFNDDIFFGGYDNDEIRSGKKSKTRDSEDFLRNDDVCPDKNGNLDKKNIV